MPGMVEIRTGEHAGPIYESRPLTNVPEDRKRLGSNLWYLSITTFILSMFAYALFVWQMFQHLDETKKIKEEERSKFALLGFAHIMNFLGSLLLVGNALTVYSNCCSTQYVTCDDRTSRKNPVFNEPVIIGLIGFVEVLLCLYSECWFLPKIVTMVLCVATCTLAIANLQFSKKNCQCKECIGLEDVKITYGNVTISITEQHHITHANLKTWLNIPDLNDNRLAIQIKGGEIIFFSEENVNYFQLHEGEYYIREISTSVVPLQKVASVLSEEKKEA